MNELNIRNNLHIVQYILCLQGGYLVSCLPLRSYDNFYTRHNTLEQEKKLILIM